MFRFAPLLLLFAACASTTTPIPQAWRAVPKAAAVTLGPRAAYAGPVRVEDGRLMNGTTPLTDRFPHIDSFDVFESRREVVFSARREKGYDIGLAAIDGSQVNWFPADPADETNVSWAPRGNKVSYVVRTPGGDLVRTVHVPTSFALTVAFPFATVHDLAWEPRAERYTVVVSSPIASPYQEELRYGGEDRRIVAPPATRIHADPEAFGTAAVVIRPPELQYNEKLPVVVWEGDPKGWNDARGALLKTSRIALVITKTIDGNLLTRIRETKWMDQAKLFLVTSATINEQQATVITPDPAIPPGTYRKATNRVHVSPADIESFSAGYIADQLKRTTATHGSSR